MTYSNYTTVQYIQYITVYREPLIYVPLISHV